MKKLLIAAALALACSACATTPAPDGPSPIGAVVDKVIVSGTQGLILANLFYQSVGTPVAVAIESGAIPAPVKAQIKAADRVVITALRAGAAAQDEATKARAAADALDALALISRLTGIDIPKL